MAGFRNLISLHCETREAFVRFQTALNNNTGHDVVLTRSDGTEVNTPADELIRLDWNVEVWRTWKSDFALKYCYDMHIAENLSFALFLFISAKNFFQIHHIKAVSLFVRGGNFMLPGTLRNKDTFIFLYLCHPAKAQHDFHISQFQF